LKKLFNIREHLHCKSKCHETKPMHPFSWRAFQRHQEHNLKHPSLVNLITTKQNKLPSFIDRLVWPMPLAQVLPCFQLIFPFKTWFFGIYLNFQLKSKHHETKLMHTPLSRAFQRDQECNLKHPGLVDLICTKQTNYLAS
jgi:hypothetical protein